MVGIGGSLLYFIEDYDEGRTPYDGQYNWLGECDPQPEGAGFYYLDHLTHNVMQGNMDTWYKFYATAFNFREIKFFDIQGKMTGLTSRALTSPCGKIRIPINESSDDKSQIVEYLRRHETLSQDTVEYSLAMLMNMCLCRAGRTACEGLDVFSILDAPVGLVAECRILVDLA